MSDFQTELAACAARIDSLLDSLLPKASGHQSIVIEAMRYAALGGGKRLRPFLVIQTAKMLGHTASDIEDVAAALECLHVYSLVHDDLPCMDDDDLRRGKSSCTKE